jgi:DNA-binding transcriptional LysR family regulator
MDRLEPRELEYFVALAEELHFGQAADRLGITQPALSRAIGRLERRLRVSLVARTSRSAALTPAGSVLLAEARGLLACLDTAARRVQQAGSRQALVVAARPSTGTGLLRDFTAAYRHHEPAVTVDFLFTRDPAAALRDARADVALVCKTDDITEFSDQVVGWELPVALLPSEHPLAKEAVVTLADLRSDPAYSAECPDTSLDEIVDLVALGRLVVMAGESVTGRLGPGVSAVPVADSVGTTLALAWLDGARQPVAGFVAAARTVTANRVAERLPEQASA